MATYNLSLSIEASNAIVAEWRYMLGHILREGVAVANFYMAVDGMNLVIETTADVSEDTRTHLELVKV